MSEFVDLTDQKNRIAGIQRMIRAVGLGCGNKTMIIPITGVFDETTEDALKAVQCECGLPEDGKYSVETWRCLKGKYDEVICENSAAAKICPFPDKRGYELKEGERSELALMVQVILNSLRMYYGLPHVPLSGVYGEESVCCIREFQEKNGLEATGSVNKSTWNRLAEEYNGTVNDNQ